VGWGPPLAQPSSSRRQRRLAPVPGRRLHESFGKKGWQRGRKTEIFEEEGGGRRFFAEDEELAERRAVGDRSIGGGDLSVGAFPGACGVLCALCRAVRYFVELDGKQLGIYGKNFVGNGALHAGILARCSRQHASLDH
jgi:hypothetical protein